MLVGANLLLEGKWLFHTSFRPQQLERDWLLHRLPLESPLPGSARQVDRDLSGVEHFGSLDRLTEEMGGERCGENTFFCPWGRGSGKDVNFMLGLDIEVLSRCGRALGRHCRGCRTSTGFRRHSGALKRLSCAGTSMIFFSNYFTV